MHEKNNSMIIKRTVDVCMTVLMLCLMSYQIIGDQAHEWIGIGMTGLVVVHQILNRKWYGAFFRGKYNAYRTLTIVINIVLILSFMLTALCGISMSGHALPFFYGMLPVSFARRVHLSMSNWSFVLMGLHLGIHTHSIVHRFKINHKIKIVLSIVFCFLAGIGLFLFLRNGMLNYLLFKVPFASFDYEKAWIFVFIENIIMLLFWVYVGAQGAKLCRKTQNSEKR